MRNQNFLFVLEIILLIVSLLQISSAEPDQIHFAGGNCTGFDNFNPNSTYHKNVNSLFSKFNLYSHHSKFSNVSIGSSHNRVNGIYHCRPDLSLETCNACINAAVEFFTTYYKCSTRKEAILWYHECTVRYSNRSIFNKEDVDTSTWMYSTLNVSQPQLFSILLNRTMEGLIAKSVLPSNSQYFATWMESFTWFEGLYGLALCTPDITSLECEHCLRTALSIFPTCCGELVQFAMVFLPSCHIRYDTAPFILEPPSLVPVSTSAPAPSP